MWARVRARARATRARARPNPNPNPSPSPNPSPGPYPNQARSGARFQLCKDGRARNESRVNATRSAARRRRRKVVGGFDDVALGGFAEQRADGHLLVGCTERTKRELWRKLTQQRVFRLG